ncbi:hypothetical protein NKH60_33240 [Mesorhizobium sp. M1006]|uniref:hypothetical protein n=1 Tax=Mesorhizobium sp. M1006 TaxID=2957048 RepID=UPI00333C8B2F
MAFEMPHATFSRLLRLLDPEAFGRAFAAFAAGFARERFASGRASVRVGAACLEVSAATGFFQFVRLDQAVA